MDQLHGIDLLAAVRRSGGRTRARHREAQTAGCLILGLDLGAIGEKLRKATNGRTFGYNDADEVIAIQRLDQQDV